MALALILALEHLPEGVRVRFDIGKNRFLRWQLGEEETVTRNGLPSLASVKDRSELIGPLRPEARGRGEFTLPAALINRDTRWLQIFSYREPDGSGPAMSAVTAIPVSELSRRDDSHTGTDLPPPAGFALAPAAMSQQQVPQRNRAGNTTMTAVSIAYSQHVDNAPFCLRERPLSQPMFWQAIVGALPSLLPMLAPAIGSLVSGIAPAVGQVAGSLLRSVPGGGGAAPDAGAQGAVSQIANLAEQALRAIGPAAQQLLTPENMRQIMQLIQAGSNAAAPGTGAATGGAAGAGAGAATTKSLSRYSQAQVAPALLAALPALMPLLQQVLSPQTIQGVLDAPQKMTGQI